jgi:hypothetical protein
VVDHLEVVGQNGRARVGVVVTEPGPVQLDDSLALAGDAVPELGPVDLDERAVLADLCHLYSFCGTWVGSAARRARYRETVN